MSAEKLPPPLPLRRPPGYRDPNAQVRHHPPPPLLKRSKRRRACCRICCGCLCAVFLILIIAAAAGLAFYLVFQPRLPVIHVQSIQFTVFNVTAAADGPAVDAASTVTLEIKNPNQNLGVVYGSSHVLLSAVNGDVSLGEQTGAGFSQDKDTATTLKLPLKVEREIVDGKCEEELKKGLKSKNLKLNAEISSAIGLKHPRWSSSPVKVNIFCGGMRLSGGSMPRCRIKLFNWVFIN